MDALDQWELGAAIGYMVLGAGLRAERKELGGKPHPVPNEKEKQ